MSGSWHHIFGVPQFVVDSARYYFILIVVSPPRWRQRGVLVDREDHRHLKVILVDFAITVQLLRTEPRVRKLANDMSVLRHIETSVLLLVTRKNSVYKQGN